MPVVIGEVVTTRGVLNVKKKEQDHRTEDEQQQKLEARDGGSGTSKGENGYAP